MTASPARSLLERAAEVYDFESSWKLPAAAPAHSSSVEQLWPAAEPVIDAFDPGPVLAPVESERDFEPAPSTPADHLVEEFDAGPALGDPEAPTSEEPSAPAEEQQLADAPITLPATPEPDSLRARGFVVPDAPPTVLAEEFRLAKRMPLAHAFGTSGQEPTPRGRLMLICSANTGEGKSFCAINLALSLAAERDTRVVLVDGDVAKPGLPDALGLPDGPGLIDAITDPELDPEALLVPTEVPNLTLLPAGSAANNATELLASGAARACLDRLIDADPRRIVVIDSPPLLAASPALSLTLHVGQAILVVRADKTTEGELRDAYALLDRCPTVHLLLNAVSYASGRTRLGSYYGVAP